MTEHEQHMNTKHMLKEIVLKSDFNSILDMCILSDTEKTIMKLHYVEKKPFDYISDILGYSLSTIKAKHRKVLKRISKMLLR